MKQRIFKSFFYVIALAMITVTSVGCDSNDPDDGAPFLKVSPSELVFGSDGNPVESSQASFNIEANRQWIASIPSGKDWITLSQTEGNGTATVNVSIPEGINDEAQILIEIKNNAGTLLSETVTVKSGSAVSKESIYTETVGTTAVASPYPYVDAYSDWAKSGTGSSTVTYSGAAASVRASGIASSGYEGASGPNVIFFGASSNFVVNKITLKPEHKNLKLTFGASCSQQIDGAYNNTFDPSKFEVALSSNGTNWTTVTYTKNDGDSATPYWIFATADFTLKEVPSELYIKFTALIASVFRLDDITLATGAGGTEVDLAAGSGGGETGTGDGTESKPYSVASAMSNQNNQKAWVKGYIVGGIIDDNNSTSTIDGPEDVVFGTNVRATAVLIADSKTETDYTKCVVVNLPTGAIRTAVNLKDNPENLGVELQIYGVLRTYFGIAGVRDLEAHKLGEGGGTTPEPTDNIFGETLMTQASFDKFSSVSVTGAQTWTFSSQYGAVMSGFADDVSHANEDWFISPTIDLSGKSNVTLSFDHARGPAGSINVGVAEGYYTVWVSNNYTNGAPSTATWTELSGITHGITAWGYVSSGNVTIPTANLSANCRIAFKYLSIAGASATWEVKNIVVK